MIYLLFKNIFVWPIVRHILRPTVIGLKKIPKTGAAILAANHISSGDAIAVPMQVPRRISFAVKSSIFTDKGWKAKLLICTLRFAGQVPIDRSGGEASQVALDELTRRLQRGELIGIFPEGTRSPDGRFYRSHTGVARLALSTGAPVIPIGNVKTRLHGGFLGLPSMKGAHVTVGDPMDFTPWQGQEDNPQVLRWVTNQIAIVIHQMTGQTYVDTYANRIKAGEITVKEADAFIKAKPEEEVPRPPTNAELESSA